MLNLLLTAERGHDPEGEEQVQKFILGLRGE